MYKTYSGPDTLELKEQSVAIPLLDEITATTIKNRVDAAYAAAVSDMNVSMFGDRETYKPTWRDRLRWKLNRVHDAWLVLTGKADIGDW